MSDEKLDIEAISRRAETYRDVYGWDVGQDIRDLLNALAASRAEVDRLTEERDGAEQAFTDIGVVRLELQAKLTAVSALENRCRELAKWHNEQSEFSGGYRAIFADELAVILYGEKP